MAVIVPWPAQGTKKCSGPCGRVLPYDIDEPRMGQYTIVRRRRKGGVINPMPYHMCRRCKAKEVADRKAQNLEETRRKRREWYAGLDRATLDARREYSREYAIARAREAGVQPRAFRTPRYVDPDPGARRPAGPLLEWLDEWQALTGRDDNWLADRAADWLGIQPESVRRQMQRLRSGEARWMNPGSHLVEAVTMAAGMPEQIHALYPPE